MRTACWGTNKLTDVAWVSFGYGSRWDLQRDVQVSLDALKVMARFDFDWRDDICYGYEDCSFVYHDLLEFEKTEVTRRFVSQMSHADIHKYSPFWITFPHLNLNEQQTDEKAAHWIKEIIKEPKSFSYAAPKFYHNSTEKDANPYNINHIPAPVSKKFEGWEVMQRIEDMMSHADSHHFSTNAYKKFREEHKECYPTPEELEEMFAEDE